ncbi:MAG: Trk system potassium transporter TrkA [Anaeroplasma bactoclasticum]|nr:Trk system potassium transporter TrkA [Anaeroplasma bactoclasticum]
MKIVVIGCGTIGGTIIEHVSKEGHNLVIIDDDKKRVEALIEHFDVLGVVGNGASLDIQEEAGVRGADLVIAVTPEDEINILACMVAKKLGAKSTIARVRNPEYSRQTIIMQEELGLSMVVNPEQETADEITSMVDLPSLLKIEPFAKGKVNLIELLVDEDSLLKDETLISLSKKLTTKVLICAVQRNNQVIIPTGNFKIQKGDRINLTADASSLVNFLKELNLIKTPLKHILIIGGGKISYYLAKELLDKRYHVKMIENNAERAEDLAELLPKATIIYGDGTDHDLLLEEGIESSDACIALTNIDEENIIVSMYAQKLKVKKVIAKVKRSSFMGMVSDLGIANTVSPKDIVANRIISYIRALANKKGSNVLTLYKLVNNQVEALEFHAKKKEKIFDKPLKDLHIRHDCLIACIIREGKVIIPNGNDCITLNDSVLIVTTHQNFDDLMDAFE